MKRSPSELALQALLQRFNDSESPGAGSQGNSGHFPNESTGLFQPFSLAGDFYGFKNQETTNGFSTSGGFGECSSWYQNFAPQQPSVSATVDSQSSMCVGSPTSILKPKVGGNNNQASGSSEDEDGDTCEQSDDRVDVKRIRRMASNRESARRSRTKRQAHLQDLEKQVENLSDENAAFYRQLTGATQQLNDATTNNRVLKSDVEALRAKVKLAEDRVARGSLSCSLNQLLQSAQLLNATLPRVTNVSPTNAIQGQDAPFDIAFPSITDNDMNQVLNENVQDWISK